MKYTVYLRRIFGFACYNSIGGAPAGRVRFISITSYSRIGVSPYTCIKMGDSFLGIWRGGVGCVCVCGVG